MLFLPSLLLLRVLLRLHFLWLLRLLPSLLLRLQLQLSDRFNRWRKAAAQRRSTAFATSTTSKATFAATYRSTSSHMCMREQASALLLRRR